jgi:hypothetical protein
MNRRPRLKSHVQPLRRGPGSLQLGLWPGAGVVLDGLSDAEIAVTAGLDGSLDLRTLYAVSAAAGVAAGRLTGLIATLDEHHLLVDSATEITDRTCLSPIDEPRRNLLLPDARALAAAYGLAGDGYDHVAARSAQHVVISGEGDLPCALATLLRVSGIGRVSVGANAVDTLDLELRSHRPGPATIGSVAAAGPGRAGGGGGDPRGCGRTVAAPRHTASAVGGSGSPGPGRPAHRRGLRTMPQVPGPAPPRQGRRLACPAGPART